MKTEETLYRIIADIESELAWLTDNSVLDDWYLGEIHGLNEAITIIKKYIEESEG